MTQSPQDLPGWAHDEMLGVLARAGGRPMSTGVCRTVGRIARICPNITVIENRTGLVMLPMRDTAKGTHFHLGEALMSEARIAAGGYEGYGMRRGRDLEAAMAMAVVDLAVALGHAPEDCAGFLDREAHAQAQADHDTLCRVEATRVDMETF